jgi:hypothetical protein
MTVTDIRNHCPAVFAEERDPERTSGRYEFIRTYDIVEALMKAGYGVSRAQQKRTHAAEDMKYARHLLTFRPITKFNDVSVGDAVPEVVLLSAHNGTTAFSLLVGLYRFICANGMIVGDSFESIKVYHRGDAIAEALEGTKKVYEYVPKLRDWVEKAQVIELNSRKQNLFAEEAMSIRYGDARPYDASNLLHVRRPADKGNTMWKVFNRVQENLLKGGIEGQTATGRRSISRAINRVTKDVTYNQALWDTAEQFLQKTA